MRIPYPDNYQDPYCDEIDLCWYCGGDNFVLDGCLICGAPVCCQDCCKETTKQALKEMNS